MKGKFGRLLNWGIGAFSIIMKNKIVSICCFLVPGLFHTFNPEGSLDWDTMMLSILLMLYAAISIVFVLTNKNETVGKGKDIAGNLVKGYFEGQRDNAALEQELFSKSETMTEHTKSSNERLDKHVGNLKDMADKTIKKHPPGIIALLITYILLLALGIAMFIWRGFFVNIVQIILGLLLIADGVSSIVTVAAAYKSKVGMKNKVLSIILAVFTIALGVVFVILPADTAPIIYRITGIMLIIKAVFDFIVMIRNRELISSVKDSINEIRNQ